MPRNIAQYRPIGESDSICGRDKGQVFLTNNFVLSAADHRRRASAITVKLFT